MEKVGEYKSFRLTEFWVRVSDIYTEIQAEHRSLYLMDCGVDILVNIIWKSLHLITTMNWP